MTSDRLVEIAEVVMGQSPQGSLCNNLGIGLPLLNGPTEFGFHHPTPVQFTTDPRKVAVPGDLLFCVRGSTTGRMNWADQEYAIGRGIASIRHKKGFEYQPFLKALIDYRLPDLLAEATGSTFPNVSYSQIANLTCNIPSLSQQLALAQIFGALDDKIVLNRQMNRTLEAIAQAIFKSWFVDFDPVVAKAEGRKPYGMSVEEEAGFPDRFVTHPDVGDIPQNWRLGKIRDLCELRYGKALKENARSPGEIAVFGSNGQIGWHDTALIEGPGIIVGRKGNAGKVNWSHNDFYPIDTTFYVVASSHIPLSFIFYMLKYFDLENVSEGSAVPGINREIVHNLSAVIPPNDLIIDFDRIVSPMISLSGANEQMSRSLETLRDNLLPKLLSGEIRIKQAEKLAEQHL